MINSHSFKKLKKQFEDIKNKNISDILNEKNHLETFTFDLDEIHLDASKNIFTQETLDLFKELAKEVKLEKQISDMFKAEKINFTEQRAVLHHALRNPNLSSTIIDGHDFKNEIIEEKNKIESFTQSIRLNKIKGYSGKNFDTIVNIGIGGSYLGTQMACNALKEFGKNRYKVYFISNIDASNLEDVLQQINPETTLFVIASKTFTTQETMTNAHSIKDWFVQKANEQAVKKHFIALSTNLEKVSTFGITKDMTFGFWDFIGGRYSIWSSIGMPLQIMIGNENIKEFHNGAHLIDKHIQEAPLEKNIPFLLAAIGIWYNNFFNFNSYSILAYDYRLRDFTRYIQQLEMESNGKYINKEGKEVKLNTSPVVFGEPGTDSQHSFFQMIHQGTSIIPCDFIGFIKSSHNHTKHQNILFANMLAQSQALMEGKTIEQVTQELKEQNKSEQEIQSIAPHKVFKGNRPSNIILFNKLTPKTLGMLCAIYEHKIFIQGIMWNINSFDQWGVELGKVLANDILEQINNNKINTKNLSTKQLLKRYNG